MKTVISILFTLCFFSVSFAQLTDDFSDNDFTSNPGWQGDIDNFIIENGVLRLSDQNAGSSNISYLSVEAATSTDALTTWRFFVQMDFSPSSSNNARIYLSSNNPTLSGDLNGYYLRVGGISGSMDSLEFFRQDGGNSTLLGGGTAGAVGSQPVIAQVEVQRDEAGNWTFSTDYTNQGNLTEEFSITDDTYKSGQYFGFYCRYSASRSDDFFFDDVFIDPLFVDRVPPVLIGAEAINATTVVLQYDEPLDGNGVTNASNYNLDNGVGNPVSAMIDENDLTRVILTIDPPLISLTTYTITTQNIADASGNASTAQTASFTFFDIQPATAGDLIITEILADPSSESGLPEFEFFELFNASNKVLQLNELLVSTGSTPRAFSDFLLLPGAYVTVCSEDAVTLFEAFGPVVGVNRFPALSNSRDEIVLTNQAETTILSQVYDDDWYDIDSLSDGGYSLELILLDGPLDCPSNWITSRAPDGGTPGSANTAASLSPEQVPPGLMDLSIESDFEIQLVFNEQMDINSVLNVDNYRLSPDINISSIIPGMQDSFLIVLESSLQLGTQYDFIIDASVSDCIGNTLGSDLVSSIGLPEDIAPGDLIINEILFFPASGGKDFVEFLNVSNKTINLNGLILENTQKESGNNIQIIESNFLVFPGEYIVITEDTTLEQRYTVPTPSNIVSNDLPTLDNNEGNITLKSGTEVIDAFDYLDDFHLSLLENDRGVSLERLSPTQPTQQSGNWHSASQAAGFATPTGPNSQNFELSTATSNRVTIENPRFSPDDDGFEDVLLIQIEPESQGFVANIKIFDVQGRLVNDLIRNNLLGTSALFKWDGITNENQKARIGPYIVWVELFDENGNKSVEKLTVVVAGRLD